ncbi:alpha-glucosidase [Cronobacter universalis]|uniref:Alpha-amylase n=1 Tax=Cronobacter universalis NCTC 9529 TaxID=1074000 RepID=A0AAC8VNM9_9ENTR|nr:alpha-glucosidase [Cronobacter universalis]ALB54180.1 oligo-1,6-glucosidase [Cronobacter universalis NCTC 9529]ELY3468105.1 alpha-glucosidase [Cronobacter universalis]ELY6243905.1 alpha-glucosidase [Cronobacter universalis]MDI7661873.1 alpha-glucosidase [Cronobacter universalis]STD02521.1 Oligo-1,6-glucosidase [Cronobacter universalis NCTC 9529]
MSEASTQVKGRWWKEATAYQIYPRSFKDSNGDGIGDLNGIIEKLDYLKDLGIDLIWICPMYPSPNDDNGYDISDYQGIMAEFGTMADFDRLLEGVHQRGMRLILDLVVNHTSDEHPWFLESRASTDNPKRDWYIWRDGKNGAEPNNWESIFSGSAWKRDDVTGQYFMHLFSSRQPDLNWENHEMRAAVYDMMRWWLDKGIDGFRIDAIAHMKKEPTLSDVPNPEKLPYAPSMVSHLNYDGLLDYVDDICRNVFNHYDIVTVGEMNGLDAAHAEEWVGENRGRLNMVFQFEHVRLWEPQAGLRPTPAVLRNIFTAWQQALEGKGWNALYVENHDVTRVVSRWGDTERHWRESATCIAAMYFLMQGTPFIYQGQEIGMTNTRFASLDDFDDVSAHNKARDLRDQGMSEEEIVEFLTRTGRDNSRTPMQWDASPYAGFSTHEPWLKVNPNYEMINVESQQHDPHSVLNFYRQMIHLRKREPALIYGRYETLLDDHEQIYAYRRVLGDEQVVVLCNFSGKAAEYDAGALSLDGAFCVLANLGDTQEPHRLRAWETRVYKQAS